MLLSTKYYVLLSSLTRVFGFKVKYTKDDLLIKNACIGTPCQELSWTKIDTTLDTSWVFSDTVSGTGDFGTLKKYNKDISSTFVDEASDYLSQSIDGNLVKGSLVQDSFKLGDVEKTITLGDISSYSMCAGRSTGCLDNTENCQTSVNSSGIKVCEDKADLRYAYSSAIAFDQNSAFLTDSDSIAISVMDSEILLDGEVTSVGGITFNKTASKDDPLWSLSLQKIVIEEFNDGSLMEIWTCPESCSNSCRGIIDTGVSAISMSPSSKSAIWATNVWDGCVVIGNDNNCEARAASSRGLPSMLFVFGDNVTMSNTLSISRAYYGTPYCPTCLALAGYDSVSDCDIFLGLAWLSATDVGIKKNGDNIFITLVSRTVLKSKDGALAMIALLAAAVLFITLAACVLKKLLCPTPKGAQIPQIREDRSQYQSVIEPGGEPDRGVGMVFAGTGEQGSHTSYNPESQNSSSRTSAVTQSYVAMSETAEPSSAGQSGNRLDGSAVATTELSPSEIREQRLKALGM